jgi:hypothetical protein
MAIATRCLAPLRGKIPPHRPRWDLCGASIAWARARAAQRRVARGAQRRPPLLLARYRALLARGAPQGLSAPRPPPCRRAALGAAPPQQLQAWRAAHGRGRGGRREDEAGLEVGGAPWAPAACAPAGGSRRSRARSRQGAAVALSH